MKYLIYISWKSNFHLLQLIHRGIIEKIEVQMNNFPIVFCHQDLNSNLFSVCISQVCIMFGKKKKKIEISGPSNFEHRVHTGFDPQEQKFTGLPQQWHSLLADTANRPKPMVDPSCITPIQLAPMKVWRGFCLKLAQEACSLLWCSAPSLQAS